MYFQRKKNCGREIEKIFSEKKELYSLGGV
jgi:hypothetical protein